MKYYYQIIMTLLLLVTLQACSKQPTLKNAHIVTIAPQHLANSLFYAGTVQPLRTLVIPSPADGVIIEMPFQYGEPVAAGKLLFVLSSAKFLSDYKTALTAYIKAKNQFDTAEVQLKEGEFLHKNQLISDDDYKTKQSGFYGAQLELLQSKDTLENLIQQLNIKDVNPDKLSISDINKINEAMHLMSSENLRVLAPAAGVVLSAMKSDEESKKLSKGDVVKLGDVLAIIGDMSGISVRIKVNELTVNQLHAGMKVKITGIAFPDYVLNGAINRVDRQGESLGGGLPTFTVDVTVPKLSHAEQKQIHVGMSAKIEIKLDEEAQVSVPIAAIKDQNGMSFVDVYDEQSGKVNPVPVKTGKSTIDAVEILGGLKVGDKIVVPN